MKLPLVTSLRRTGRRVIGRLAPRHVDVLLYELDVRTGVTVDEPAAPWRMVHFTQARETTDRAIARRLRSHRECWVVEADGRVVHQCWVHLRPHLPAQCGFADAPLVGDALTSPAYRGQGLFSHALRVIAADLARRGVPTVHVLVAPTNDASIHAIEHAGFVRRAHIRGTRVLGLLVRRDVEDCARGGSPPPRAPDAGGHAA